MKDEDKAQAQLISELRQMRRRVAEFEQDQVRYKQFLDEYEESVTEHFDIYYRAPDMFVLVDAQAENVRHCNKAIIVALGYSRAEIIGNSVFKLYHRDCVKDVKEQSRVITETGEIYDAEQMLRKRDGSKIDVSLNATAVRDEKGNLTSARFVWRDITRRKGTERELSRSEQRFHQLAESIREVFWLISLDGCEIFYISPAYEEIWGRPCEELIAQPMSWFQSIHASDRVRVLENIEKQKRGEFAEYEYRICRPDRSIRWIQARASPVRDARGVAYRLAGCAQDITQRKQAEQLAETRRQQLIQADKMTTLGVLASSLAHEISNPTSFVMLNGQILELAWEDVMPILEKHYAENGDFLLAGMPYSQSREKIAELSPRLLQGAQRIENIVSALQNYVRQSGKDLDQKVDCNSVVEWATIILENQIESSTDRFSVNPAKNLPIVSGDPGQLEQVLINLIDNSCAALSDPSQSLTVSTRHDKAR